jgi:single-stranded DNA-specific DHH superfamily exonuclease
MKLAGSIVVSHRKDADGISSASLIRFLTGAEVYLTDYSDMVETLSTVGDANEYYVCDLGSNQNTFPGFLDQMKRLASNGTVHYIDHHPLPKEFETQLRTAGVKVTHSVDECSSVLVYSSYEERLKSSSSMKILACCGAITDYMDSKPIAKRVISLFDRQFLLYEAIVLSFTISMIGRGSAGSNARLINLVEILANGKLPHQLEGASDFAQLNAQRSAELIDLAKAKGKKRKNFAYFLTEESATGNVANFLIGAFDVPVGVAIREEEDGWYEISLRSTDDSKHNLGKIMGKITTELGTSRGGHPHASGARIKITQLERFLTMLDEELSRQV